MAEARKVALSPAEAVEVKNGPPTCEQMCTWSISVNRDGERLPSGQFPYVWRLKFVNRACRAHGNLRTV